jgi:hypothetical protein
LDAEIFASGTIDNMVQNTHNASKAMMLWPFLLSMANEAKTKHSLEENSKHQKRSHDLRAEAEQLKIEVRS